MNFNVCNLGSKQPYFNSSYAVKGYLFSATPVIRNEHSVSKSSQNMAKACILYLTNYGQQGKKIFDLCKPLLVNGFFREGMAQDRKAATFMYTKF